MAEFIIDLNKMYDVVGWGKPFPELIRRSLMSEDKFVASSLDTIPYNMQGRAIQSQLTLRVNGEDMKFSLPKVGIMRIYVKPTKKQFV